MLCRLAASSDESSNDDSFDFFENLDAGCPDIAAVRTAQPLLALAMTDANTDGMLHQSCMFQLLQAL